MWSHEAPAKSEELLGMEEIGVRFGANTALDGVSLSLASGEILGLMGANGAGKSTLAKVIVGEIPHGAYTGVVRCRGTPVTFANARAAHDAGIALVHQEGAVVPQLSIGENVMLTIEPARSGFIDWDRLHTDAASALQKMGMWTDTRSTLGMQGGVALMGLIEIARAIARGSRIFVFDESTSVLGADEIGILLAQMRELAAQGAGIIFISHRIDEILQVCDRVVVLREGQLALDAPSAELDSSAIIEAMIGARKESALPKGAASGSTARRPMLSLAKWRVERSDESAIALGPLDLELAEGEILAVYGPLGAGKTELLQSLFGLILGGISGKMRLAEQPFAPQSPRDSIAAGIAYVSAERQRDGLVPQLSVLENMMLGWHRGSPRRAGRIIDHDKGAELCRSFIRDLAIRTMGPGQPISALSGGNQQKVLLARALVNQPSVVLLDEPTRGIDLGAKQDVYRLVRKIADEGAAVLYTTLEETEALEISHRILVMRDGRPVRLLITNETNQHELLALAGGR